MKQILKWIIAIPIILGIAIAGWITIKNGTNKYNENVRIQNLFENIASKPINVNKFYTYGTCLNIEGEIDGVLKDNFEGIKLILTDGEGYKKLYSVEHSFSDKSLIFYTQPINNAINLDELKPGKKYYIQVRVKTNNNKDYKYYTLSNSSDYKDIEYYTVTKDGKNNKVYIKFEKVSYKGKSYDYLGLNINESKLPKNVYDIVIDSGHGGTDKGQVSGNVTESDLMLEYGKMLKGKLEEKGYKVKLDRDDDNTDSFTSKNMYSEDGRISICCKSKAKYMVSLHTDDEGGNGIEVYLPNNSEIDLGAKIASNLYNYTSLEYSKNKAYKVGEGLYLKNFDEKSIPNNNESMKSQGLEPYNLTVNTPRLYTIREVGGIATNAFVDGRKADYGVNKYYNSNQGIECYQISIGNLKNNKDILLNEKEQIINAISDAF